MHLVGTHATCQNEESHQCSAPGMDEKLRLCDEFAKIADSDSTVARCYLAENEWEMEVQYIYICTVTGLFLRSYLITLA